MGGSVLPYRLTIPGLDPKSRGIGDPSWPIVVALHGAGGDENMFHWGYGAGLLERLAEEKEFILVSPLTTRFSTRPEVFDALLDAVASMTPFADRGRVCLLGHSLGAMAAGIAGRARKDKVAGVCLIAGLPPGGSRAFRRRSSTAAPSIP